MAEKNHLMDTAKAALKAHRWEAAENLLLSAQRLAPLDQFIRYSLAIAVHAQGRSQEAIALWKQILVNDPHNVLVLAKLGAALCQLGHELEGLSHSTYATELEPTNVALLTNLSVAWMELGNYPSALPILERALLINPERIPLLYLKLSCLSNIGRYLEARALALFLLSVSTDPVINRGALCVLMESASHLSDWPVLTTHHEHWRSSVLEPGATSPSMLLSFAFDDPKLLFDVATARAHKHAPATRPARLPSSDDRVCVGYLSADFREHPVAQMLIEVLLHHDRSRFRVVLIFASPVHDSPIVRHLLANADAHIDVSSADTFAAREMILAARIEVLIDLSGIGLGHRGRVLETRPCPAQILWLGCPVTTGMKHYDAFLVDAIVAPAGYDAWCSEPLVRLPCCYHPISFGLDTGHSQITRADLGIPANAVLVGMLQMPNRIHPPFIDRVVEILARHPSAHFILRALGETQEKVSSQLIGMGLSSGAFSFVKFFPERSDYLQMIRSFDLIVDSHPYGGHSTSGEAIALGVPVLTMLGNCIHSRVASSMLHEVGLGDLVTHTLEELASTLDDLIANPGLLQEWKHRFAAASTQPKAQRNARLVAALEASYVTTLNKAAHA